VHILNRHFATPNPEVGVYHSASGTSASNMRATLRATTARPEKLRETITDIEELAGALKQND
jgi:hypothetical protein